MSPSRDPAPRGTSEPSSRGSRDRELPQAESPVIGRNMPVAIDAEAVAAQTVQGPRQDNLVHENPAAQDDPVQAGLVAQPRADPADRLDDGRMEAAAPVGLFRAPPPLPPSPP